MCKCHETTVTQKELGKYVIQYSY
uniref:Uncharacterized protein n=1 Tax=Arundo donax TaxID=35708 RepID=A0A0A9HH69_ARUDO